MPRNRTHTRRTPRSNPRGVIDVRMGGYGFVKTPEGEFYVPASKMGGAFDGDLVELAPLPARSKTDARGAHGSHDAHGAHGAHGTRKSHSAGSAVYDTENRAARVVRVIDRAHDRVIGRYEIADPFGVVVPEDPRIQHDIFTMRADAPQVPDGALVRVRITTFPSRNTAATGVIEEVLGDADTGDFGIDLIIARHKLETTFSQATREQAAVATLDEEGALRAGYRDVRDRLVFTIDPADARDFDDALSLARVDGMWRIGVHIADVSHYVAWESSIDLDARRRATSVYLPDRVIPMLPEELSNELCSLKPGCTRRSMTVDLFVDDDARLLRADIYPALICSRARLSYDQVQEMLCASWAARSGEHVSYSNSSRFGEKPTELFTSLRNSSETCSSPRTVDSSHRKDEVCVVRDTVADAAHLGEQICTALQQLSNLAQARVRARAKRGSVDFDTKEAKVRLDDEGRAVGVDVREKNVATSLVEEMMIFANEAVATYLEEREQPCIYRVHAQPHPDALASLVPIMQEFPWFKRIDEQAFVAGDPRALQAVLTEAGERPEGPLITTLLLRSMQRAVYAPTNEGHYGLASTTYCHFTSPIRRYPDLVVHRMLKAQLAREGIMARDAVADAHMGEQCAKLSWLAEHSSEMERIADAAARQSQEYKMIEYLQDFVGQRFWALISGMASYGLYVQLDNTAEGLLPVRDLGSEYFSFDPARYVFMGCDTGKSFRLGARIPVVLKEADPRTRTLRFALAE